MVPTLGAVKQLRICVASLACAVAACAESDGASPFDALDVARWHVSEAPLVEIGVADGDERYQLFRVRGAVRPTANLIVVANTGTQELRYFDRRGRFLHRVGGRGRGPGEFQWLRQVYAVSPDSIAAYDDVGRLSYFDGAGAFLGSQNVSAEGGVLPSEVLLYRRALVLDVPQGMDEASVRRALDRLPPPPAVPGYWYVRVDRAGRFWASASAAEGGDRSEWIVLSGEGVPLARVTTPARFEMLEITDRDVLGRWRDTLDVEFVRVYALEKPDGSASRPPTEAMPPPPPGLGGDASPILDAAPSLLRSLVVEQERFFADNGRYAADRAALDLDLPAGMSVDLVEASGTGWLAIVAHRDAAVICGIGIGGETPPGWSEGRARCGQRSMP